MKTVTDVRHCDDLMEALTEFRGSCSVVERWGRTLAARLAGGARLLVAGNGGSAAQAQHLTAELVGRYQADRPPFSALALHADTSATTAIANDYGVQEVFARQTLAHGRPGDILMLLSTSGASANLLTAADAAHRSGLRVWALTGSAPNPLAGVADEALCVHARSTATVQELHLVAVHMICAAFDRAVEEQTAREGVALGGADSEGARLAGVADHGHAVRDGNRAGLDGAGGDGHGARRDGAAPGHAAREGHGAARERALPDRAWEGNSWRREPAGEDHTARRAAPAEAERDDG